MRAYGISGPELEFFNSYLRNRVQYCSINGSTPGFKSINCGVPQGSILGHLLFLIYMNDLSNAVENVEITTFADDTSLSKTFQNTDELCMELIPAFANICKWLMANKHSLNTVKTEFIVIGTSQRVGQLDIAPETTSYALFVKDASVRRVKQVKDLGLIIDENLTWDHHINYISQKNETKSGYLKAYE